MPINIPANFSWPIVIGVVVLGIIGFVLGIVGIRRGHGLIRLIAVLGTVLSLVLSVVGVLLGLFILFPPQIFPPGPFL